MALSQQFLSDVVYYKEPSESRKSSIQYSLESNLTSSSKCTLHINSPLLSSTTVEPAEARTNLTEQPKAEYKKLSWAQTSYEGTTFYDNLHGPGFYFTQENGDKFFYDGMFYTNKLEGYSQVFYENGTHFQGLFKKHLRYGPGVLTHPDGTQDVGFWKGFKLIRLVCAIGNDVPTLASSPTGKTQLLSSKYLVSLQSSNNTRRTLEHLFDNTEFAKVADEIFNKNVRNPKSLFFYKNLYDEQFFGRNANTIKVQAERDEIVDDEETSEDEKLQERVDKLKLKIFEVNETFQTYVAIKLSLVDKVRKCTECCASTEKLAAEEATEGTELLPEQSSLDHFFDASLPDVVGYDRSYGFDFPTIMQSASEQISNTPAMGKCSCDEDEYKEGLEHLEEQLRNICSQELFYRNIRDELKKKVDALTWRLVHKEPSLKFKLVDVNELWAWNNEESMMSMQQHCFRHRNSEDMVNFSVPSLILGNRKDFGTAGPHESTCKKFLAACSKGKKCFVTRSLRENKVDPNLSDSRGNTGIFFASANNQQDIVSILTNFGAKLDQVNDEQLTPLSMCLLKYIGLKNQCKSWEKAFLPETKVSNLPELPKWYDLKSLQSTTSMTSSTDLDRQNPCSNLRIIDLFRKISNIDQSNNMHRVSSAAYMFDLNCTKYAVTKKEEGEQTVDEGTGAELESTNLTLVTLLDYGANPNVSEVPFPPLVLSLFTENPDLVKEVIKANADIGIRIDNNMSCLHIAASLKPCRENANICMVLVKYGCNPNLTTSPGHWSDRRSNFSGKLPDDFQIEDNGKNALHLLCMRSDYELDRSDYFCSVAKLLLETNLDISKTYLEHTPLSLAVISGNLALVDCLLKTNLFDPYKPLQYGMGNILTLHTLKRFETALSVEKCKSMLDAFFAMDVNVLHKVYESENAIVFAEECDTFFDQYERKDVIAKKGGKEKKPKVDKRSKMAVVIEYMKHIGRQTIIKQIQMTVTEMLYEFVEEDMLLRYEISATLASEFLTPTVTMHNLKLLFERSKIEQDRLDLSNVRVLAEFAKSNQKTKKTGKVAATSKEKGKKGSNQRKANEINVDVMVQDFDVTLNFHSAPKAFVSTPGLDDPEKYKICFHCLRGIDKALKTCPRCQTIRFCSAQCNKLNMKLKTAHGCSIFFYDMTEEERADVSGGIRLSELVQEAKSKCKARLKCLRESKLIEEEQKLLEMWRADTYGTKFLQIKSLLEKAATKKKDKQLNWNIGLLKGLLERNFQKSPGEASLYSLKNILLKLHGKDWYRAFGKEKSEGTIRTKQSWSTRRSTLGGSTLHSIIFQSVDSLDNSRTTCKCTNKVTRETTKSKVMPDFTGDIKKAQETKNKSKPPTNSTEMQDKLLKVAIGEEIRVVETTAETVKKLKTISPRYQRFIEVLGTYFPDTDFTQWLLPYACCSDGQFYYKFCSNNDAFNESYSFA